MENERQDEEMMEEGEAPHLPPSYPANQEGGTSTSTLQHAECIQKRLQ